MTTTETEERWEQATFHINFPEGKRTRYITVMYVHQKHAIVSYENDQMKQAFYSVKDKQWVSTFTMWQELAITVERLITGKNTTKRVELKS